VDEPADASRQTRALAKLSAARRSEQALQRSLRETEAIMRNAPVGIVLTRDRCILRYDRKFAEMYGFEGDQGDGRARACAVPLRRRVRRARRGGRAAASPDQPFQDELFMRRQDGSDFST
jgi:PAS domain-containing protein